PEGSREEVLDRVAAVLCALDNRVADALEHLLEALADLAVANLAGAVLNLLRCGLDLRIVSRARRQGRAHDQRRGQHEREKLHHHSLLPVQCTHGSNEGRLAIRYSRASACSSSKRPGTSRRSSCSR